MTGYRLTKLIEDTKMLPARERQAVVREVKELTTMPQIGISADGAFELIGRLVSSRARTVKQAASDRRGRVLVGARVPRAVADRYRAAAADEGISLYAWVRRALDVQADGAAQLESPETVGTQGV